MGQSREWCPACGRPLLNSRFDTAFRLPDRSERLCFGVPGSLCRACHQLYLDPDLIGMLDLDRARCTFAIESDLVMQQRAGSGAD